MTTPSRSIKAMLVCTGLLTGALWLRAACPSKADESEVQNSAAPPTANSKSSDYVGSDLCEACHQDQATNFSRTIHAKLAGLPGWKNKPDKPVGCESCHGPGKDHVENGGDKTKIRTFKNLTPEQISDVCLNCHAREEERNNFRRGDHGRNNVACTSCHATHSQLEIPPLTAPAPSSQRYLSSVPLDRSKVTPQYLLIVTEPKLCENCHNETKAQFSQPYHHRVPEGGMKCSDCHNPHGGFQLKQARLATGVDAVCLKCHIEKQGPFVFEHAPVKEEGCVICHLPHGSNNPRLLRRSNVAQLCLECHSSVGTLPIGAPGTPNFHNLATVKFQNCTTCHVFIHGSNASKVFFR